MCVDVHDGQRIENKSVSLRACAEECYENEVPGKLLIGLLCDFHRLHFCDVRFPLQCAGDAGWINASTETNKHIAQPAGCSLGCCLCWMQNYEGGKRADTRCISIVTVKIYILRPTSLQPPAAACLKYGQPLHLWLSIALVLRRTL